MTSEPIDLDRLLRLRLIVGRFGEADAARWWNTKGQLGPYGTTALRRGFPRTHRFAQARSVFAVAARRSAELFDPPRSVTLWSLPAALEEEFDARWETWLDAAPSWEPFFKRIEAPPQGDLLGALRGLDSVAPETIAAVARLRKSAEARAVQLPSPFDGSARHVELLAAAFSLGEPGYPVVPYARLP